MAIGLSDLDELILCCRNERARSYIREAVACYKAGAFRASIVSTWTAVCYDYIQKVHDLQLAGSTQATQDAEILAKIRSNSGRSYTESLKFEREVLVSAFKKYELLTSLEFHDLERLREDRNRCAHPTMQSEEEPYTPTPELARTHLRNAVEILLSREPVQGKEAFTKVINEIDSEYFPEDREQAIQTLSSGPLKRPRFSLLSSIVQHLVFNYFTHHETEFQQKRVRILNGLNAIRIMHSADFTKAICDARTVSVMERVPDERRQFLLYFFRYVDGTWESSPNHLKVKCTTFIRNCPKELKTRLILTGLYIPALKTECLNQLESATPQQLAAVLRRDSEEKVLREPRVQELVLKWLASVNSYDNGRNFMKYLVMPVAEYLNEDQIGAVLETVKSNTFLVDNYNTSAFLADFLEVTGNRIENNRSNWQDLFENARSSEIDYSAFVAKAREYGFNDSDFAH